jgi:hypothetical protein
MPTAIVSGALANKPGNGGSAWTRLSLVRGLGRLGFDTFFVEQLGQANAEGLAYFDFVVTEFGLADRASLLVGDGTFGMTLDELRAASEDAALLLNIGGHLNVDALKRPARVKVFLDDDPGFTQFWAAQGDATRLEGHDVYFTFGQNIGEPLCPIPTAGIEWRKTVPPVVLADWPVAGDSERDILTTVGSWRGPYGPIERGGRRYGLKVHEFRKVIGLPERAPQTFELALDIHPDETADLDLLERHGWRLVDPRQVAADPDSFRRYVQRSGGEFSAAQGVYVDTESGWISDRTIRYLASGKPALVQETGFSRHIPSGEGLLSYRTLEEAVAGAEAIAADYDRHARAARRLAREHFDSDKVLTRLLADAGVD